MLRHALRAHPAGMPPYILCNDYLPPVEFPVVLDCEMPAGDPLRLRRTHERYRPQVADRAMLAEVFPGFETEPQAAAREQASSPLDQRRRHE